jgi:hypothetical protein
MVGSIAIAAPDTLATAISQKSNSFIFIINVVIFLLFRNGDFKHFIPVFSSYKNSLVLGLYAIPFKTSVSGIV